MRVLLVEDDARVAEVVSDALRNAGHVVTLARDRAHAQRAMTDAHQDLAIIDVGLPDGSGLDFCRALREDGQTFPILILTARTSVDDRVRGLDFGADDYLGKPFATAELVARVRALGRRGPRWTESRRDYGTVQVDRDRRLVMMDGDRVPLTPREFDIVALLAWRDRRVVPREEILEIVWGETTESAAESLDVLIARIRRKLGAHGLEAIRTVRQVGYAWALTVSKPA